MSTKNTNAPKFSMKGTKEGALKSLYLVAGLFAGGLIEQYAMSKVAFLADTKTDPADATKTVKNTVGVLAKSVLYIGTGLVVPQLTKSDMVEWAGYGLASYGALKGVKSLSDSAKVFGLGGVHSNGDVRMPYFPQYQLNGQQPLTSI